MVGGAFLAIPEHFLEDSQTNEVIRTIFIFGAFACHYNATVFEAANCDVPTPAPSTSSNLMVVETLVGVSSVLALSSLPFFILKKAPSFCTRWYGVARDAGVGTHCN